MDELIIPWSYVLKKHFDPADKEYILETAWQQLPNASKPIYDYAAERFIRRVRKIKRRSKKFDQIPLDAVRVELLRNMERHDDVASAVISLWADARREDLERFYEFLSRIHLVVPRTDWTWEIAAGGTADADLRLFIPDESLMLAIEIFATDWEGSDVEASVCDFLVASYWFSRAVLPDHRESEEYHENLDFHTNLLFSRMIESKQKLSAEDRNSGTRKSTMNEANDSDIREDMNIIENTDAVSPIQVIDDNNNSIAMGDLKSNIIDDLIDENSPAMESIPEDLTDDALNDSCDDIADVSASPINEVFQSLAEDSITHTDSDISRIALSELPDILSGFIKNIEAAQQRSLDAINDVAESVKKSQAQSIMERWQDAGSFLETWILESNQANKLWAVICNQIQNELTLRQDLVVSDTFHQPGECTDRNLNDLFMEIKPGIQIVQDILRYDDEKKLVENEWEQELNNINTLRSEIVTWRTDPEETDDSDDLEIENAEICNDTTLREVRRQLSQARQTKSRLESELAKLRSVQLVRIGNILNALAEFDLPPDEDIGDGISLKSLSSGQYQDWSARRVQLTGRRLINLFDRLTLEGESASSVLAAELQTDWQEDVLLALLDDLVQRKKDEETLILLLAANQSRLREEPLQLSKQIVESCLNGFCKIAGEEKKFQFLGLASESFLPGWHAENDIGSMKLCIAYLSVYLGNSHLLPQGILWQVASEWPGDGMPTWHLLWTKALHDDEIVFIEEDAEIKENQEVDLTREAAEDDLRIEARLYIRARSLKNAHYTALANQTLLPKLGKILEELKQLESTIRIASQDSLQDLYINLKQRVVSLGFELSEEQLEKFYDSSITSFDIHESDPFHRRSTLHILVDSGKSVHEYAQALLKYARSRIILHNGILQLSLQNELGIHPELNNPECFSPDQMFAIGAGNDMYPKDQILRNGAITMIEDALLGSASFALRLPHIVGHLVSEELTWKKLLDWILEDLANPPKNSEESAKILLDLGAPSQVLRLAEQISLPMQKEAQQLLGQYEKTIRNLVDGLSKYDTDIQKFDSFRHQERWKIYIGELQLQLDIEIEQFEQDKHKRDERNKNLLERSQSLQTSLASRNQEIPSTASQLILDSLVKIFSYVVNSDVEGDDITSQLDDFVTELEYQFSHSSWPLEKLQDIDDALTQALSGGGKNNTRIWNAPDVLLHLDRNEFQYLGLNSRFEMSKGETRVKLLGYWEQIRKLKVKSPHDLLTSQEEMFYSFYNIFAQMTSLQSIRTLNGEPIKGVDPFLYAPFKLKYPKTVVLEKDCVLLALPGDPPSSELLQVVDQAINENEWLNDRFVILFLPGKETPKIRRRFEIRYNNRGLVLIDESTIVSMVLAEAEQRMPVGYLRSFLLNAASSTGEIDVFKINQLVKPRTAIFAGRDAIINKITSTGNNYALYGGRRIGKSSILSIVEEKLKQPMGIRIQTISLSFEGIRDCSDDKIAQMLSRKLALGTEVDTVEEFDHAMQSHLDDEPNVKIAILLDEMDKYINHNQERHLLIETFRSLSDRYADRFRVIVAGFMDLYDCIQGRGPYTSTSDPWRRMIDDDGPVPNLRPNSAELIVKEGFRDILGWEFESRLIPQNIVERTGRHPAFIQYFCMKVQRRVAERGDQTVRNQDVKEVFSDLDPDYSFFSYVKKTLEMNLGPISRFLILMLANEDQNARRFTVEQYKSFASYSDVPITDDGIQRSLERLIVTSVVRKKRPGVYEFTVPDYPKILYQMGETSQDHLGELEQEIAKMLEQNSVID